MKLLDECLSIGCYTLTHELGRGSTAIVYKGTDAQGGEVCVKKSNLDLIGNWKARELFEREASVLEQLSNPGHPGVPKFIDRMDRADSQYLVLEYVDGQNLQELVEEERCLTPQEGVHMALQALDILHYVHSRNVIHRDLKPSNLVLGKDGKLRLIDYSTVGGRFVYPADGSTIVENYSGYMPPDFLNGKLDPKSDIYSLGATLFYAMTGLRPIEALTKKGRIDMGRLKAPRNLRKILKGMTELDLERRLDLEGAVKRLLKMGDMPEEISGELREREMPSIRGGASYFSAAVT
ncbi:MAG: serine/threonine-protein kinase [Nanoarchaeota archaeon]|nr:serine/threonine-protein kinase [Nanoarchaeota archaeon]